MNMLEINGLSASYGHVNALDNISMCAKQGQIVSIIGSNGAGKTTLLKCISGLVRPTAGVIKFLGEDIPDKPHKIVKRGIVHVPEGRRTFSGLTIRDNLLVGGYIYKGRDLRNDLETQYELFPILRERKDQFAGTMSGGEQQMLAISRGLMAKPKLMLLDEPSLGLAPIIVNQVFDLIKKIRDSGVTIVLVEQNARKALSVCDYAYVLENGSMSMSGEGSELIRSEAVVMSYLGGQVKS